jgi:hypothetical protein
LAGDYGQSKALVQSCNKVREKAFSDRPLKAATSIYLAASWREPAFSHLPATIEYLQHNTSANIIIIGPRASFHDVPTLAVRYGKEDGLNEFVDTFRSPAIEHSISLLRNIAEQSNTEFIDVYQIMCPNGLCIIISPIDKKIMYSDYAHLTMAGTEYLAKGLSTEIDLEAE